MPNALNKGEVFLQILYLKYHASPAQIKLNDNERKRLEALADKVGISTLTKWERDMKENE